MKAHLLLPLLLIITGCSLADVAEETDTSMQSFDDTMDVHRRGVEEATGSVTREQLSQHDTPDDCWVAHEGEVYDVTSYLEEHPGGAEAISNHCGKASFTEAFQEQHKDTKDGTLAREGRLIGEFTG